MSGEERDASAVEIRRIDERLQLLHEDVREIKAGLESRPTHSDLGSFKLLVDKTFDMVQQRMEQNNEIHKQQLDALKSERARVEKVFTERLVEVESTFTDRLAKVEKDARTTREEKDNLHKQFVYSVIGGIGAIVGTNIFQGVIG